MKRDRCRDCGVSVTVPEDERKPLCACCEGERALVVLRKGEGASSDGMDLRAGLEVIWLPDVPAPKLAVLVSVLVHVLSSRTATPDQVAGARRTADDLLGRGAAAALASLAGPGGADGGAEADRVRAGLRVVALPHDMTRFPPAPVTAPAPRVDASAVAASEGTIEVSPSFEDLAALNHVPRPPQAAGSGASEPTKDADRGATPSGNPYRDPVAIGLLTKVKTGEGTQAATAVGKAEGDDADAR